MINAKAKETLKNVYSGKIYANEEVLAEALERAVQGPIETFKVGRNLSCAELEKEYESRGLVPAGVLVLGELCETNQKESGTYIASQWRDRSGEYCYAAFYRWGGDDRSVNVSRGALDWDDSWVFAGVRKFGAQNSVSQPSHSDTLPLEKLTGEITFDLRTGLVELRSSVNADPQLHILLCKAYEQKIEEARSKGRQEIIDNMTRAIEKFARG